jgi:hypothetical protein
MLERPNVSSDTMPMQHPMRPFKRPLARVHATGAAAAALLVLCLVPRPIDVQAQSPVPSSETLAQPDLDQLLDRYFARRDEYLLTFRNLVAEETKLLEVFRGSGEVDKRREIVSDLLVYRASGGGKETVTEYRDVRSVDGKAV